MSTLFPDTVTVLTPEWTTDRGVSVPDFTNVTATIYDECSVQPMTGEELHGDRQGVVNLRKLFGPSSMVITAHDRVMHDGVTYAVEDPPQSWKSPTGSLDHVEAVLRRVEG